MRVLVTGDDGFLGAYVKRELGLRGHTTTGLDVKKGPEHDIRRAESVVGLLGSGDLRRGTLYLPGPAGPAPAEVDDVAPPEACVHLAAIASPWLATKNPTDAWLTNVLGTFNVLALCRELGVRRFVFMSSAHAYGISPRYLPTDENHPLALLDTYTTTKIFGERACELFFSYHGLSYCALRLFNAIGIGQSADYFVGAKIRQAIEGDMTLKVPEVTKDWVAAKDVARAIALALESDFVGPVNIGTGIETSLRKIAEHIADAFGRTLTIEVTPDPGPTRMCAHWGRARNVLGWEPTISVDKVLDEIIADAKENQASP